MPMYRLLSILLVCLFLSSCSEILYSPDAYALARNHRTIAIVPPSVSSSLFMEEDAASAEFMKREAALNFQTEMYTHLLKRRLNGKLGVELLDIETTNAKLAQAGYPDTLFTTAQLCNALGVEAILTGHFELTQPHSEEMAIFARFFGIRLSTNEVYGKLSLKDCAYNKLIWTFDRKSRGSLGSTSSKLVKKLMIKASKELPY
jgi:hypothetical protein